VTELLNFALSVALLHYGIRKSMIPPHSIDCFNESRVNENCSLSDTVVFSIHNPFFHNTKSDLSPTFA
jgi:hypothetical protein